jgi:cell division protein FtsB
MRKKRFVLLILSLFLILFFFTFFGDKGILHLLRLKKELVRIKEINLKIEEENRKLKEEVRRLKYEKRYIEEIARKELGMVKEGEIIYQFDEEKGDRLLFDKKGHVNIPIDKKSSLSP